MEMYVGEEKRHRTALRNFQGLVQIALRVAELADEPPLPSARE
jgi:hypothetical protein